MNKTLLILSAWTLGTAAFGLPALAAPFLSLTATLSPAAPRMGDNTLDMAIADGDGKPITDLKLSASVAMASMDMGTTRPAITEIGGGHYKATVNFSMNGPWRVMVRGQSGKVATLTFEAGAKTPWKSPLIKVLGVSRTTDTATSASSSVPSTITPPAEVAKPAGQTVSSTPTPDRTTSMAGMDMKGAMTPGAKVEGMTGIMDMKTATVPQLQEKGTYIATGDENWPMQTGFGHNAGTVGMMIQMMVGGSGMEGMKMPAMTMKFGEENYAKPDADRNGAEQFHAAAICGTA